MKQTTITITEDTLKKARAATETARGQADFNRTSTCLIATGIKEIFPDFVSMGYTSLSFGKRSSHNGKVQLADRATESAYIAAVNAFDAGRDEEVRSLLPLTITVFRKSNR